MNEQNEIAPPKLPLKFLRWFCNPNMVEDVEGDISELFSRRVEKGKSKASLLFTLDVLFLFRPGMIKNFELNQKIINYAMLRNYLKIAQRNALRYKGYTFLNLLGLIVGIASSILILLWVNDEVSVDKFHSNGDQIFQLFRNMRQTGGVVNTTSSLPKPLPDLIREEYPEVDQVALYSWPIDYKFSLDEKSSVEYGRYATPEFFDMFSFEVLAGSKETMLDELNAVVISKNLAEKFFGVEWQESIGQSFRLDEDRNAIVTAVFESPGASSSLQFDWILPAQELIGRNDWINDWGNGSFDVFLTIKDQTQVASVSDRLLEEINTHTVDNDAAGNEQVVMQKFQDTYLYSNFDNGIVNGGRIDYVRIMLVVAIFILIVACINFMNLATARSGRRSKEIGLRKVMGSHKSAISVQFFVESFLLTGISVVFSVVIVLITLPYYNQLVDKTLFLDFTSLQTWLFLGGITLIVSVLSGSYPALLLSRFGIIESLKGTIKQSKTATFFRKGLVVFQFGISTLLIIGMAVILKQLDFVLNKDLGMEKENLIAVRLQGDLSGRLDTYKNELLNIPEVTKVTAASGNPINYGRSTSSAKWEGMAAEGYEINILLTEKDFIDVMGMEMKSGRAFSSDFSDSTNFLINEVAAELMGFDDPLNKDLSFWGINGKIVGVVKNFHMMNLRDPIAPLIIANISDRYPVALVRVKGEPNNAVLAIEEATKTLNPAFDFEYEFIEQVYAESYDKEQTVSTLAKIFATISVLISCLGLFGLSAFTAEKRSREIGVRKVHGASVFQILVLLSKDYSRLMLFAFILAIPFGYYFMHSWLNDFEFRTSLSPGLFILAGVLTFIIGVATVSAKSYQAAKANPVNSLKDE